MAKLIICNTENLHPDGHLATGVAGSYPRLREDYRRLLYLQSQRMIWHAEPGDVLVLPVEVPVELVDHVLGLLEVPSGDVLIHRGLGDGLAGLVRARGIDTVLPYYWNPWLVRLATTLGLREAVPGAEFAAQGGAELLNRKSTFRAIAAGTGVPLADGAVTSVRAEAEALISDLLDAGRDVILKQDFELSGFGNEVLSRTGRHPVGARRAVPIATRAALTDYLDERWAWLTGAGPVTVEHFLPDATAVYAGMLVGTDSITCYGTGAMRMGPIISGLVTPDHPVRDAVVGPLTEAAGRLCAAVRAIGYRGQLSVDAVVTPDGEFVLNEFNARMGGATHVHRIAERVTGADRVLASRTRCRFGPLPALLRTLHDHGLAYDTRSRTGVLITGADNHPDGASGEYVVVAGDHAESEDLEKKLADVLEER